MQEATFTIIESSLFQFCFWSEADVTKAGNFHDAPASNLNSYNEGDAGQMDGSDDGSVTT